MDREIEGVDGVGGPNETVRRKNDRNIYSSTIAQNVKRQFEKLIALLRVNICFV